MSGVLAQEQSLLLGAIAGHQNAFSASLNLRGLQVYQANRAVLAGRTLAGTFPVVCELIGWPNFESLACHFWQQHPPQRGDMGQWGSQLPAFLEAAPQLADEPFLPDVARIEWALHDAADAPDAVLDAASFALLSDPDVKQPATMVFSPGVCTFSSAYPVASIIHAHFVDQPTLDEVAAKLRQGTGEDVLVWRQNFKPEVRATPKAEYRFVCALQRGTALESALAETMAFDPAFDFTDWLTAAVQTGLITGATLINHS